MLQNTDKIIVENRSNSMCVYRIPETNYTRQFVANERKEIPMGELRAAVQIPGTCTLIKDDLIIHSKEAVDELFPDAEPEYFYTVKDVDFLLTKGTLDQLKDALDFAPEGVVNLIKDEAVKGELNDVAKREAILEQTGFDVTKAIEANAESEKVVATPTGRRAAPVGAESQYATASAPEAESNVPARRTAAPTPKYRVVVDNK
jgi:hypothetical protein